MRHDDEEHSRWSTVLEHQERFAGDGHDVVRKTPDEEIRQMIQYMRSLVR